MLFKVAHKRYASANVRAPTSDSRKSQCFAVSLNYWRKKIKYKIRLAFSANVQRICKSSLVNFDMELVKCGCQSPFNFPWGLNSLRKKDSQKLGQERKPVTRNTGCAAHSKLSRPRRAIKIVRMRECDVE